MNESTKIATSGPKTPSERLVDSLVPGIAGLAATTLVVDLLLLVQPLYMLQVYDRVIPARSLDTLLYVSLMALAALVLLGVVDAVRGIVATRTGARLSVEAGEAALAASVGDPSRAPGDVQPLRDLATVRSFFVGRSVFALLDLPFAPLFVVLLWFVHPHIFLVTAFGALVLVALAVVNQRLVGKATKAASDRSMAATTAAQAFSIGAESIVAMGMRRDVAQIWGEREAAGLAAQDEAGRAGSVLAGASRVVRLGLQMAILGYGGWLVVDGRMTAGMIFAASLISGRALQPIDQVVAGWKGIVETGKAWRRLTVALDASPADVRRTELPDPVGLVEFDRVTVLPRDGQSSEPLLKRATATIEPGECVAVLGPSGAGKSTLLRVLVGAVVPYSGLVRIDGAALSDWNPERLGRRVGYLAQDVDLLPGTIAQNVSRFDPRASDADILAAASKAHVHDMILRLPKGYDTLIGPGGVKLSGGQRQRIGLARAFYGDPRILVLDEPNSNLDMEGEKALEQALAEARSARCTVLVVTQKRILARHADRVMIVKDGAITHFAKAVEILEPGRSPAEGQGSVVVTPLRRPGAEQ